MATIEGKPAAEWFKSAAQRQKHSNAYAKYEEPKPAEPARQTAAPPKAESHASPAKPAEPAEPAKKADTAQSARPAPGQAKGTEAEWESKKATAKQAGRVRSIVRRAEDEGRSSLHRLQAEARAKSVAEAARHKQFEQDWWDAKNGAEKVMTVVGERITEPVYEGAKKALSSVGRQYAKIGKYVRDEADKGKRMYSGIGRWLVGDPEAKKRVGK